MSERLPEVELRVNAPLQECDLAIVSIDDRGLPGRLNRSVLEALGYTELDRPGAEQLRDGHFLLESEGRKPIIFVVIVGDGRTEELLPRRLEMALAAYGERFYGARYWLPLLGTGRGGLSDEQSLRLMLEAITKHRRMPYGGGAHILISLPETAEAQALIESFEENGGMLHAGGEPVPAATPDGAPLACFLVKMTPASWYFPSIRQGDIAYFNTHFYQSPRPEYELLRSVKPGDRVIGFAAGEMQQVWGLMEVIEPPHDDRARGEIITLVVRQIFANPAPLNLIRDVIDPDVYEGLVQVSVPPRLFFSLADTAFNALLQLSDAATGAYVNPFRPSYLTEGRHKDTDDQLDFRYDIESFATIN